MRSLETSILRILLVKHQDERDRSWQAIALKLVLSLQLNIYRQSRL